MNRVLHRLIGKFCAVYLDDIIIYSVTFQDHCNHVQQVFDRLKEAGLKIKPEKCTFVVNEVSYLGHIVGSNGIKPDQKKIQTMVNLPILRNPKEVRMALGLFSYYRRFIQDFAKIAGPLHNLTKRSTTWNWTIQHQDSFDELKFKMTTAPVLIQPDLSKAFIIQTDASDEGLGVVLAQRDDQGLEHPIAYASRKLSDLELKYTTIEKECLAV